MLSILKCYSRIPVFTVGGHGTRVTLFTQSEHQQYNVTRYKHRKIYKMDSSEMTRYVTTQNQDHVQVEFIAKGSIQYKCAVVSVLWWEVHNMMSVYAHNVSQVISGAHNGRRFVRLQTFARREQYKNGVSLRCHIAHFNISIYKCHEQQNKNKKTHSSSLYMVGDFAFNHKWKTVPKSGLYIEFKMSVSVKNWPPDCLKPLLPFWNMRTRLLHDVVGRIHILMIWGHIILQNWGYFEMWCRPLNTKKATQVVWFFSALSSYISASCQREEKEA